MPWVINPAIPQPVPTELADAQAAPQFDAPFRLETTGQPATVEQDTPEEIAAAIYNIVTCPQGAKLNDPTFGIPSPLFAPVPLDPAAVTKAILKLEPRARSIDIEQTLQGMQLDMQILARAAAGA